MLTCYYHVDFNVSVYPETHFHVFHTFPAAGMCENMSFTFVGCSFKVTYSSPGVTLFQHFKVCEATELISSHLFSMHCENCDTTMLILSSLAFFLPVLKYKRIYLTPQSLAAVHITVV